MHAGLASLRGRRRKMAPRINQAMNSVSSAPASLGDGPVPSKDLGDVRSLPASARFQNPRILLAATLRWPLAARLAMALHKLACPIHVWCPAGHPLERMHIAERIHRSSALAPRRSLQTAIRAAAVDFIIPCDDDAAVLLHHLHAFSDKSGLASPAEAAARTLIERSLGTPASCSLATNRNDLMHLAGSAGLRVPLTRALDSPAALDDWAAQHRFPAVLKIDGSWGGLGVTVVHDIQQAQRALQAAMRPSVTRALTQLILRRDPSYLLRCLRGARPAVTIQKFITGRPANCAVACWQGEVLAGISVVAIQSQGPIGPATVVQVIKNEEMSETARRLVRVLGLSGLYGMDFVIEASTGAAYLIEVNPRATPISHLALGAGQDLPAALCAQLRGELPSAEAPVIRNDVIALFPGEWRRDPQSPYLYNAIHDVPWDNVELMRDCTEPLWETRGIAARIKARLVPRSAPALACVEVTVRPATHAPPPRHWAP